MILNLGCGKLPIEGAVNIDVVQFGYTDLVMNIADLPLPFKDNSIDGVYMIHVFEHLEKPYDFVKEIWRILKPGGFFYLQVPHSSNIIGIGDFGHYRTFNYSSLHDYLTNLTYISKGKYLFKTLINELWWYKINGFQHPYLKFKAGVTKSKYAWIVYPLCNLINKLIKLSPVAFERGWWWMVGGADELVWKGIKL